MPGIFYFEFISLNANELVFRIDNIVFSILRGEAARVAHTYIHRCHVHTNGNCDL